MSEKENSNDLIAVIKAEIEKNEKAAQRTWVYGGLVVAFMAGYLLWIQSFISNDLLHPESLAKTVVVALDDNLPQYIDQTEAELLAAAPGLANTLRDELRSVIVNGRKSIQEEVDNIYDSLPILSDSLSGVIRAQFEAHGKGISEMYQAHDSEKFAGLLVDSVIEDIKANLEAGGLVFLGEGGINKFRDEALQALKDVNFKLVNLIEKTPGKLSRSERLQKKLLVAWFQVVNREMQYPTEEISVHR